MNAGLTAISWLDWKLGAALLKHPRFDHRRSLAAAISIAGRFGIEVAGELRRYRLPFDVGSWSCAWRPLDAAAPVEPRCSTI